MITQFLGNTIVSMATVFSGLVSNFRTAISFFLAITGRIGNCNCARCNWTIANTRSQYDICDAYDCGVNVALLSM